MRWRRISPLYSSTVALVSFQVKAGATTRRSEPTKSRKPPLSSTATLSRYAKRSPIGPVLSKVARFRPKLPAYASTAFAAFQSGFFVTMLSVPPGSVLP